MSNKLRIWVSMDRGINLNVCNNDILLVWKILSRAGIRAHILLLCIADRILHFILLQPPNVWKIMYVSEDINDISNNNK